ncbi:hypothetical protein K435DRAFT_851604 [Dendrothele bispora CBS 962.96]|uniref:C2H2-type domain-containing protein n=1 Tax=Dendrothele bispora (strain CBS 962.96) TaxID=1314807 RepID=A0A4S8MLC9_DENBC|nr:hypothetical protein K435DRAFT_851604 [Dendrothele bispora CBS 962.96]
MLQCPFPGCIRFFKRPEDRKRHLTQCHRNSQPQLSVPRLATPEVRVGPLPTVITAESVSCPPSPIPPSPSFSPVPSPPFSSIPSPPFSPAPSPPPSQSAPLPRNQSRTVRTCHPYLTGDKCNSLGDPLPADAPPDTPDAPPNTCEVPENPWEPFNDMVIPTFFLNLWHLSLAKHDDVGPFHNHEAIHEAINSIKQGSAPWHCFVTTPDPELPADASEWKKTEYEVWYRDPETVIKNMLDNPEFAEEFDTKPYVELKADGTRRWSDVMSGNYMCQYVYYSHHFIIYSFLCPSSPTPSLPFFNDRIVGALYYLLRARQPQLAKNQIEYLQALFAEKYPEKDVQVWRGQLGPGSLGRVAVVRQTIE